MIKVPLQLGETELTNASNNIREISDRIFDCINNCFENQEQAPFLDLGGTEKNAFLVKPFKHHDAPMHQGFPLISPTVFLSPNRKLISVGLGYGDYLPLDMERNLTYGHQNCILVSKDGAKIILANSRHVSYYFDKDYLLGHLHKSICNRNFADIKSIMETNGVSGWGIDTAARQLIENSPEITNGLKAHRYYAKRITQSQDILNYYQLNKVLGDADRLECINLIRDLATFLYIVICRGNAQTVLKKYFKRPEPTSIEYLTTPMAEDVGAEMLNILVLFVGLLDLVSSYEISKLELLEMKEDVAIATDTTKKIYS